MKILVAEGSLAGLETISITLKKLGHTVISAANGEQVIDLFVKEQPDLVILDVLMQHMSGFECAQKLRKINKTDWIPVIFLSGSVEDESTFEEIGVNEFLTKPINEDILAAKIRAMQHIADIQKKLYKATNKLNKILSTDLLTGIENRQQFDKIIADKIAYASRYNIKFALLIINLDDFKSINEHLGHHIGDLLLQAVAKRLKISLRKNDFIARLGSDEFAVMLCQINHSGDAGFLAQKLMDILANPYHLAKQDIQISCSIGIACYPTSGTTHEAITQHAELAMYHAKESGRNNFQYYTDSFHKKDKRQFYLENSLRASLINNELMMYYQPIFQLHPKKFVGMEALIRWNSPKFGLVLPETFIPIAEARGLIISLSEWALNTSCDQAAKWSEMGYNDFKLSVNIYSLQFPSHLFVTLIKKILQKTKFPAKRLELELTESSIMKSSKITKKVINELSKMKIGLSLDDFGTGYSSLAHLKNIPIATLKIDRSFVMDIHKNSNHALILKAIICLGRVLNLNLIAEGIETQEQLDFLIEHECSQGQGYYLSKPLSTEEMGVFMKEQYK